MTLVNASIVIFILALPVLVDRFGRKSLGRLNNYILGAAVLGLLVLDWAALHDIAGGRQPNYRWEYSVLAVSLAVFGYLALRWRRRLHLSVNAD